MSASFNSEELSLFATILDRACAGIQACDQATRELVAVRILHLAQEGERDPERLLEYAKCISGSFAA
jgi:hypothetical protein